LKPMRMELAVDEERAIKRRRKRKRGEGET
jgi:hypothetical protein